MKAIDDPRMVAARIQGSEVGAHGAVALPDRITPSSHGGLPMFATLPPLFLLGLRPSDLLSPHVRTTSPAA
jgi:hypothetical protein